MKDSQDCFVITNINKKLVLFPILFATLTAFITLIFIILQVRACLML